MKLLVIGGTRFVGRHIVTEALKRKHQVTLFNRGNNSNIFPEVEWLQGDRDKGVESLRGKQFDAVIDTCGYTPKQLELTNKVLQNIKHYTFISTISVYADPLEPFADESVPLAELEQPITEVSNESYGALKVLCEHEIQKAFATSLIIRSGIIVGPHDPTDRFSYWVWRAAQGGAMVAPGRINAPLQFIDARDFASFTLDSLEHSLNGIFNVVTPPNALCFGDLLETTLEVTKATTHIEWLNEDFLQTREDLDFPLWVPEKHQAWWQMSSRKAIQAGLQFRSLEQTITDTLGWMKSWPKDYTPKAGLSAEQEKTLLEVWLNYSK
jgi:2'-hydroxyisoflavone reductase